MNNGSYTHVGGSGRLAHALNLAGTVYRAVCGHCVVRTDVPAASGTSVQPTGAAAVTCGLCLRFIRLAAWKQRTR